jgi:hypothetical protein
VNARPSAADRLTVAIRTAATLLEQPRTQAAEDEAHRIVHDAVWAWAHTADCTRVIQGPANDDR